MRRILSSFFLIIFLCSFVIHRNAAVTDTVPEQPYNSYVVIPSVDTNFILMGQFGCVTLPKNREPWLPDSIALVKFFKDFPGEVKDSWGDQKKKPRNLSSYDFQITGYQQKGEKYIFFNGVCKELNAPSTFAQWSTILYETDMGCPCYYCGCYCMKEKMLCADNFYEKQDK